MLINNLYDVSLLIGNVDVFDGNNATSVKCTVEESVYDNIPTCKISFLSSKEFLGKYPIIDGTKVTLLIKSSKFGINENLNFRVMKVSAFPSAENMYYSLECIIDFYELFRSPIKYSMKNNTSEIFKFIASQNKIGGKIYTSNDSQLWLPSECNLYQWMDYVAQHAWASQQSGYYWCMDRNKTLNFIDIDRLIYQSKNIILFTYGDTNENSSNSVIKYKDIALSIDTGQENLFNRGYDGESHHFDLLSYSTEVKNANKVRAVSEIVNINKELSTGLSKDILQFDVGNHHKNFFLAESQNRRVLSTFSTYVNLFCDFFKPIHLSEVCTISGSSHNSSKESLKSINIKYIISKIITQITSSNIIMNIELCSQGYNGKSVESY